jgi:hypothetical protein
MRTDLRPLSGVLAISVLLACLWVTFITTGLGMPDIRRPKEKWAAAASFLAMELGAELRTMLSRPVRRDNRENHPNHE